MPALPGQNVVNTPPLPGSQPQTPSTAPAWWNDPMVVLMRVLAIAEYDAKAAGEIWAEYKRLTGN